MSPLVSDCQGSRFGRDNKVLARHLSPFCDDAVGQAVFSHEATLFLFKRACTEAIPGVCRQATRDLNTANQCWITAGLIAISCGGEAFLDLHALPGVTEGRTALGVQRVTIPDKPFVAFGLVPDRPYGIWFLSNEESWSHFTCGL